MPTGIIGPAFIEKISRGASMNVVKDVLARNIEDNIAPVIYFHQLDPDIAEQEVREYVFTTRPTTQVNQVGGIHEQMVDLLTNIYIAIEKGYKLPASWISGYFGSGKSLFAKLLGLALDGMILPDGTPMDAALMDRDDTAHSNELRAAFGRLSKVSSMAVLFDIGTAAKNNESIPHTAYRQILEKIGYSSHDGVAHYEIALEDEGRYDEFLSLYQDHYGKCWKERRSGGLAPQQFRTIYKKMYPEEDELLDISTFDLHSLTITKLVNNLVRVMERRVSGKTIFIVVDEVSQYINKDDKKMLDLQSFVSEIGGKARPGTSRLWLLVTGQEKLEEESKDSVLFKLKDRFPQELRVHLDRANVREVVERRLLKKKAQSPLDSFLTDAHIDLLKLHAFECETVTRAEVLENYPLLPSHIPLFMDITQSIRNTSIRTQSDSGGVRSVLNNIWGLFNREPVVLKDRQLGTLLTLDMLYDIIGSSVDSDVQLTLNKIFEKHPSDSWESKTVKAIALLELNAEQKPVLPGLLASLLYPSLGSPSIITQVKNALDLLRSENWIHYHDKNGWSIQNNAAQDWNRQKLELSVSAGEIDETLRELQSKIVEPVTQPVYLDVRFPLACNWGLDQRLSGRNEATQVTVSFHWVGNANKRNNQDEWLAFSRQYPKSFHWVSSDPSNVEALVREYRRSQKMVARYRNQGQLPPMQSQLLYREMSESERLFESAKKELRQLWLDGMFYFNGSASEPSRSFTSFENALKSEVENRLGLVFHKFVQGRIRLNEADFKQLLERDTAGLSLVFFEGQGRLGIAYNDGGKIHFRCSGAVPTEIMQFIESKTFVTGEQLFDQFSEAPYGYARLVIKASVAGLLREERVRITGDNRAEIGSILDPGAKSLFEMEREFGRAEIEAKLIDDGGVTPRDRTAIRQFFEKTLKLSNVDNSSDMLADLVFKHFPLLKDRISEMQKKLGGLGFPLPASLSDFNKALTECVSDRQVGKTLHRLKVNLNTLTEGIPHLQEIQEALSGATEAELRRLKQAYEIEAAQLDEVGELAEVAEACAALKDQLSRAQPWRGYADVKPAAETLRSHYRAVRSAMRDEQKTALEAAVDQLKLRSDFTDLDEDQRFDVLSIVRSVFVEVDVQAVQPSLLVIQQAPRRLREAAAQAQKRVDQFVNEKSRSADTAAEGVIPAASVRVHTVNIGLRNTVIASEAELDVVLARLREKCLTELKNGAKVRFEE